MDNQVHQRRTITVSKKLTWTHRNINNVNNLNYNNSFNNIDSNKSYNFSSINVMNKFTGYFQNVRGLRTKLNLLRCNISMKLTLII